MDQLEELNQQIANLDETIAKLSHQRMTLQKQKQTIKSIRWIEANNVKKSDVEACSGEGKPYFLTIRQFSDWLIAQGSGNTKRFCEWNGVIYFTSEIIAGRMMPDQPGRYCDLKD
jgi:TolA-binding protein